MTERQKKIIELFKRLGAVIVSIINYPPKDIRQATSWAFYADKLKRIDEIETRMKAGWTKFADLEIPAQFKEGAKRARKMLKDTERIPLAYQPKAMKLLQDQTILDVFDGLDAGRKDINRFFKLTQQNAVSEAAINDAIRRGMVEGTPKAVKNEVLKILEQRIAKDGKIVTSNGFTERRYKPDTYAELVSRTRMAEAQTAGVIQEAQAHGEDLVRVSDHNTKTPICLEFEGGVFSISGTSKKWPPLRRITPFHPNCYIGGTLVYIKDESGDRPVKAEKIENIKKGDLCYSFDPYGQLYNNKKADDIFGFNKVILTHHHKENVLYFFADHGITVTGDHLMYCGFHAGGKLGQNIIPVFITARKLFEIYISDGIKSSELWFLRDGHDGADIGEIKIINSSYQKDVYCVTLDKWHTLLVCDPDKKYEPIWCGNCLHRMNIYIESPLPKVEERRTAQIKEIRERDQKELAAINK